MHAVLRQATEDETGQAAAKRIAEDCRSFDQREKLSREQIALIRDQNIAAAIATYYEVAATAQQLTE